MSEQPNLSNAAARATAGGLFLPLSMSLSAASLLGFRRGLALLCILDCCQSLIWARAYYSDLGLLPRYRAHLLMADTSQGSLYLISGRPEVMAAMMLGTILLAINVLRGRALRWQRALLWLLTLSLQVRNPMLRDGADDLLRLMLFWDIFLPDSYAALPTRRVLSLASLSYQAQLAASLLACALHVLQSGDSSTAFFVPSWFGSAEGIAYGIGVVCLWNRRLRNPWLIMMAPILCIRAIALHPTFPLTLAIACVGLCEPWRTRQDDSTVSRLAMPPRLIVGLWAATVALAVSNAVGKAPTAWLLRTPSEALGLTQDWSQIYPLSGPVIHLKFQQAGRPDPLLTLGPEEGRRSALLAIRLAGQPRIASSSVDAPALSPGGQTVVLWREEHSTGRNGRLGSQNRRIIAVTKEQP